MSVKDVGREDGVYELAIYHPKRDLSKETDLCMPLPILPTVAYYSSWPSPSSQLDTGLKLGISAPLVSSKSWIPVPTELTLVFCSFLLELPQGRLVCVR